MEIFPLFAVPVMKSKLLRELTAEELDIVYTMGERVRPNSGNLTSENHFVLNDAGLSSIKEFIESGIKEYFDKIIVPEGEVEPFITMSWLNFTDKNGYHHKHTHGNSVISGVFYISVDKDVDKIFFYNEKHRNIELTAKEYNPYNSPVWWLPIANNELILFPSDLPHAVDTVTTDTTRISLSFNVFVRGEIGNALNLKWLKL